MEDAFSLEQRASPKLMALIEQVKDQMYLLVELREKIKTQAYKEGFDDPEIYRLVGYVCEKLNVSTTTRYKLLAPFKPPKVQPEALPDNEITTRQPQQSSAESFEGNFDIGCPLSVIDEDIDVAKQKLHMMIDQLHDTFYIKLVAYRFSNIKTDARNIWLVPEEDADEATFS
jgi:hypothetical protein